MYLCIGAYFQPGRAFIVDKAGHILSSYKAPNRKTGRSSFYDFDLKEMAEFFAQEGIWTSQIEQIIVAGKPLFIFECSMRQSLLSPSFKSLRDFPVYLNFFLTTGFFLRGMFRKIFVAAKQISFVSNAEAARQWPAFTSTEGSVFFSSLASEYETPLILKHSPMVLQPLKTEDEIKTAKQQASIVIDFAVDDTPSPHLHGEMLPVDSWGLIVAAAFLEYLDLVNAPSEVSENFTKSVINHLAEKQEN